MIAKLRCAGSVLGIYFSAQRRILKGIFAALILCVSSVTNLCSGALIPAFAPPDGGWTYIYSGNAISNSLSAALDGSWNHLNGSDAWSGDGRGTGVGLAGGVSVSNGIVTMEDAIAAGTSGNDNRRIYFTRNLSSETTNANTLLNDGVTLSFRARLTPPTDPLIEITNAPNGFVNVNDGKGMFGVRQAGSSGMLISFSLNQALEDTATNTSFNFGSAGLHMNNLNGDVRSANIDPGEGGTINLLPLDPTVFHEFWITIQDNGASPGTHRVTIYVDGSSTPTVFNVTAGSGTEGPSTNYLALGLPSTPERGAFDVDFFSYKPGVIVPVSADTPPLITLQPVSASVAEGEAASFNVGVTGAPPFAFQWYRNGSPISNATNRIFSIPAVAAADDLAQFVVVVGNANGSVTSSPPATLSVVRDTAAPALVSAGSLDGQTIGVCFTERVTAASAQNISNYSVNGGAVTVLSAALRTSDGGQSVLLTVSGLSAVAGTPFTVTASNIVDLSSAGNIGGGVAQGNVMALTALDIGTPGVDPVVAGSTFVCATNQFEVLAGGSDINGSSDAFHLVYRQRTGDFDVSVRVSRLDAADRLSKAGLFVRESLAAGSRNVSVFATPAPVSATDGSGLGANLFEADYRTVTGGATAEWPGGAHTNGVPYPNAWVRLIRQGNTFTSYIGTNGVDWTQLGQLTDAYPATVCVGIGATAHTNAPGRSTTAIFQNLFFAPSPQISAQPQSLTVTNGDSASFSVSATGIGILRYQWHLNGADIAGATNSTLNIASAGSADAGAYSVTVANSGGPTESTAAILTVRLFDYGDAPNSYATLRASNGARHLFTPGIYLGSGVDVDLNGLPGSGADGDDLNGSDDEDGVRFLTSMIAGQGADLEVVASTNGILNAWLDWNANGSFAQSGEQIFTNQSLTAGTNLLHLLVPRGASAAPTFARFRFSAVGNLSFDGAAADGEVEDYAVSIFPRSDLALGISGAPNPVATSSNLTIAILVTNFGPSTATSVSVSNQLQGAYLFGQALASKGSCTRSGDTINCDLGSLAESEIVQVQVSITPQGSGQILSDARVTASETDPSPANNTGNVAVLVQVPPSFSLQPVSQTVTQGVNVTFAALAGGTPPAGYQWRFNGGALGGETNNSLSLSNVQASQEGDYVVQASNAVGSLLSATAHLTVLIPPSFTQQPQSTTNYAGSAVSLSANALGTAPLQWQWYFNATNLLSGATNNLFTLANTQKNQSGDYVVSVANTAGVSTSQVARVTIVEADFGDAPASYGTLLANNGARHRLVPGVRLGAQIDFDPDGQPDSNATGDDLNGVNDEDGVILPSTLFVGQLSIIRVVASTNGFLNAWLDADGNGNWTGASDQIVTNTPLVAGTNTLSVRLPSTAVVGSTYARFRFSSTNNLTPFGEAPDGEVEDYRVTISPAADLALGMVSHPVAYPMGTDIVYGITISNLGPSVAHSVTLSDVLPPDVWLLSEVASQGSCLVSNGIVTCNVLDLPSGTTASVSLVLRPLVPAVLTNRFSVQGVETDPVAGNSALTDIRIVQDPPVILTQPQGQTVTNGDSVVLTVAASGTDLRYQWTRNGTALSGATNGSLALTNIQLAQAGTYVVNVSNLVGQQASSPAVITVIVPLRITTQPRSTTVLPGVTVTFSVAVTGNEPISYQWFFNGTSLQDATNATFQIVNVSNLNSGQYVVRVNNSSDTVMSDPAILDVLAPPRFTTPLQNQTNFAGTDALLSVVVSGSPPFSYRWFRDGVVLAGVTNSSLVISNAQKTNSGFYLVVVTNLAGSVASAARLDVFEMDFGDAPDGGFPTTMAFNGARHVIVPGIRLGSKIDFEIDGQPNATATGDDITGNDEDGVSFSGLYLGQITTVKVVASTNGFIDAWLDFDQNGAWVDFGEQIFASQPVIAGTNLLSFRVLPTAAIGNTLTRFRFSTKGGLSYDGMATDGEVEDYQVLIEPGVDLAITAVGSGDPVLLGSNIIYSVTATNRGPSTATGVVLQDTLPPTVGLVSVSSSQGSCSATGQVLVCALGDLPSDTGVTLQIEIATTAAGMITNSVRIDANEHDVASTNSTAAVQTAVILAGWSFQSGARIDVNDAAAAALYPSTIFVSGMTANVYKVTATLSNLSHTFPDDLDILLVGPSGQAVMLMSDIGGGALINNVVVTLDDDAELSFPDNSSFISQTYKPANYGDPNDPMPPPAPAPPYANRLSAFRGTDPNGVWSLYVVDDSGGDTGFIADGWSLTISGLNPIADLGVQIVDQPHKVIVGSNLTYSVMVSNNSYGWSSGATVRDVLPANAQFLSAISDSGSCSNGAGVVVCDVGPIAPHGSRVVTITMRADQLGSISNSASTSGTELDLKAVNNTNSLISFCTVPVDLALVAVPVLDPIIFGATVSYSLSVSNKGPNPANNVVLADTLPLNTALVSAVVSQGGCSISGGVVSCALGTLPIGASASIVVTMNPQSIARITNSVNVSANEADLRPIDNDVVQVNAVTLISNFAGPAISVPANGAANPYPSTILVSGMTGAVYGASVTLSNLQDTFPDNLDVLLVGPGGQRCLLMSDAGGSSGVSGVTLIFADNATILPDAGPLTSGTFRPTNYVSGNEAFAAPAPAGPYLSRLGIFAETDPNGSWSLFVLDRGITHNASAIDGWSLTLTTLDPIADVRVAGRVLPNPVAATSNFVFTVSVTNAGPANASGIVLSNRVSVDSPLISIIPNSNGCVTIDGAIVCAVPPLISGASTQLTFSAIASTTGSVSFASVVSAAQRDLVPVNNQLTQTVIVELAPGIITAPTSLLRTNGDPVQFVVDASGTAPLSYRWFRDGLLLAGQTNSILSLPATSLADAGLYSVQVSNRVGSTLSSGALLGVKMRPVIGLIGAQATDEDTPLSIPVVVGDFETPAASLLLTAFSSNQPLLPDTALLLAGSGSNRVLTIFPATNQFGTATITLTLVDSDGIASSLAFGLTVRSVNDLPGISTIPNQTIDEDGSVGPLSFTINDLDGLAGLAVSAGSSNTGLVNSAGMVLAGTGADRTITITPRTNQSGVSLITVRVQDPEGAVATTSFTLTVNAVNDPPTLDAIADRLLSEDAGATNILVTGISSGAANELQTLSLAVSNSNPALLTNIDLSYTSPSNLAVLSFGTVSNAFGTATVIVVVTEDGSNAVQRSFQVTVNSVNDLPSLTTIGDQTVLEDTTIGPFPIAIGDVETRAEDLVLSGTSSNSGLVPIENISFSGSGSNRFVTVRPATNANGVVTIGIVVVDQDGGASSNSFLLNVTAVNDLPSISSISNRATDEDVSAVVNFTIGDAESPVNLLAVRVLAADTDLIGSMQISGVGSNRTLVIVPAPNVSGSTLITLTVADEQNTESSASFLFTINAVNDSPTLDAIANFGLMEDAGTQTVNLSGITSGAFNEGQVLTVTAVASNVALLGTPIVIYTSPNATGSLTFTPAPDANGIGSITVTVNDGGPSNNIVSRTFQVVITNINDVPSISGIADQTAAEDLLVGPLEFTVADADGLTGLTIATSSSNTNLVAPSGLVVTGTSNNRSLTIAPLTNQFGTTVITLTAVDLQGASVSSSFQLTVTPVLDPPIISPIANQTIAEDSQTAVIPFVIGDVESLANTLIVTAQSSNQLLLPESNIVLGGSGSNRTVQLTPTTNQSGSASVTITVHDQDGLIGVASFTLAVSAVNDLPVLAAIPDQTISEDATLLLALGISDVDSSPGSLTLSANSSNQTLVPNSGITFSGSGFARSVQIVPAADQFGTTTLTITVGDGTNNVNRSFVLTVTAVNDPPILNPITDRSFNEDAGPQSVPLAGITSGATNENQTLSISAVSSNPTLIPDPVVTYTSPAATGSLTLSPATNASGSALITVTISDGAAQTTRAFNVVVTAVNDSPTIAAIANQTINEDTVLTIPVSVSDPDNSAAQLNVFATSSSSSLVPSTNLIVNGAGPARTLVITPARDQSGTATITVSVADQNATNSTSFTLTVNATNDPPTLDPIANLNLANSPGNQTVTLTGITSGATNENQTLSITVSSSNATLVPAPTVTYTSPNTTGTLTLRPPNNTTGTSLITVTVNDGQTTNNTFVRTFVVNVRATANANPTLTGLTNRTVLEDAVPVAMPFTIGDSGTPATLLALSATSSNPTLIPDTNVVFGGSASNRTITITPLANQFGTSTITVSVTDTNFGSVTTNILFTVTPVNDAPIVSAIAPQTVGEDQASTAIDFSVSDVETPANALVVTATSSNGTLMPNGNIFIGGGGSNRTLIITPAANQFGSSTITVSVSDGTTNSTSAFLFTVNSTNDVPVISGVSDQSTSEDVPSGTIAITIGDVETPATNLTLNASASNPALFSALTLSGTGSNRTLVVVPATNQNGASTVTLTVNDTDGGSSSTSFKFTVNSVNDAPTLDLVADRAVNEGAGPQNVNLTGISSGASNELQLLAVTATSSNPGVIPSPAINYISPSAVGTLTFAPVPGTNGSAIITVSVNDGQAQNNLVTRTFVITVNDKPFIAPIPDQVVTEDGTSSPVPFTISDRDTPAANLALIASSSNPSLISTSGITLGGNGANRTVQLTPLPNQFGSAVITISATDSNNLSGARSFLLVVPAVNDPPTLDPISDVVLNEANPSAIVNLGGISSGATNEIQALTVTATSSNPNVVPNPVVNYSSPNATGSLSVSKAPGAVGSAVITVRVNDNQGQNNLLTRTFSVIVWSIQPTISGMTRDGTASSIRLQSASGVVYVLEATESLDAPAWLPVDSRTGTGGEITLIDSGPAVLEKFYRVRVQ